MHLAIAKLVKRTVSQQLCFGAVTKFSRSGFPNFITLGTINISFTIENTNTCKFICITIERCEQHKIESSLRISSHLFEKLHNTCPRNTSYVANFAEVIVLSKVLQHVLYANVLLCCNISHVTSYRNRKTWLYRVTRITLWPFCTWLNTCHGYGKAKATI